MDTEFLVQRLQQCSRTDKQESLHVVQQLLEIAFFARNHSLVDLDKLVRDPSKNFSDPFLRKAISCLVDLSDDRLVEEVLENYIYSNNYTGQQFLKSLVTTRTILAIHRKVNIDHIFSFVIPSLFGLDFENDIANMYKRHLQGSGSKDIKEQPQEQGK